MALQGLTIICVILSVVQDGSSKDVSCAKRTKTTVTVGSGDSFTFKTQRGSRYISNTRCNIFYKIDSTCKKIGLSCSSSNIINRDKRRCRKGDKLIVKAGRKSKVYCRGKKPTGSGTSLKLSFSSDRKKNGPGASCTVKCTQSNAPPPIPVTTPSPTPPGGATGDILADFFSVWSQFRDPINGFWCDTLRFPSSGEDLVPCGPDNNFYSSAGTGMGLLSETISAELGYSTRDEAKTRVIQSLTNIIDDWLMESYHGYLQHFTNRNLEKLSEYSTIDTAELVLGALFAANYFGGEVANLAEQLKERTNWAGAIKKSNVSRVFSRVGGNTGEFKGNVRPFNEYYLVAYMANMTSAPGSDANIHFNTFWDAGSEGPQTDGGNPTFNNYMGYDLLSDNGGHFMSSFVPQFNYFMAKGYQQSDYYVQMNKRWLEADTLFWSLAIPADGEIWGTPISGRVWGAGAGPGISGYRVERIDGSSDLVISAHIMAGFLHVANETQRQEISDQLVWMYQNDVCAYPVQLPSGLGTPKILWRCSVRVPDWRCPTVDSIDFSTMGLGLATNFLPPDFYLRYAA